MEVVVSAWWAGEDYADGVSPGREEEAESDVEEDAETKAIHLLCKTVFGRESLKRPIKLTGLSRHYIWTQNLHTGAIYMYMYNMYISRVHHHRLILLWVQKSGYDFHRPILMKGWVDFLTNSGGDGHGWENLEQESSDFELVEWPKYPLWFP